MRQETELTTDNLLDNGAVDTDIRSDTNLLNNADSANDVRKKVLTTEVTSIAREEAATGQKINVPNAEDVYNRAVASFIRNTKHLNDLINKNKGGGRGGYNISRKGMNRVLNSILQLPMDNLPVALQGDEEKAAFALGQRIIADRYVITHHHILQERRRLTEQQKNGTTEQNNNGETKKKE